MNKNKITQLGDFFYSSDDSNEIPLRLACVASHYTGFNLNREEFISLLTILSKSKNLKKDLAAFKKGKEIEYKRVHISNPNRAYENVWERMRDRRDGTY